MGKVVSVKLTLPDDPEVLEELQNRHAKQTAKNLVNNFSPEELDIILQKLEESMKKTR